MGKRNVLWPALLLAAASEAQPPVPPAIVQPKPVAPKTVSPAARVSIEASFAVVEGELAISYTVENRRRGAIGLLDIEETTSPPHFAPRPPRVEFESPQTAVLACWHAYQPPPPGTTWVTPPVFYGTRVAAGSRHSTTLRMKLPLAAAGARREVECAFARFEVAAILEGGPAVQTVEFNGRTLGRFYLDALRTQELLRAKPRPARLPLAPGAAC